MVYKHTWQLKFNSDKCRTMRIYKRNKSVPNYSLAPYGKYLKQMNNIKDLRVTISYDLSWSDHVHDANKYNKNVICCTFLSYLLLRSSRSEQAAIIIFLIRLYMREKTEFCRFFMFHILYHNPLRSVVIFYHNALRQAGSQCGVLKASCGLWVVTI